MKNLVEKMKADREFAKGLLNYFNLNLKGSLESNPKVDTVNKVVVMFSDNNSACFYATVTTKGGEVVKTHTPELQMADVKAFVNAAGSVETLTTVDRMVGAMNKAENGVDPRGVRLI